MSDTNIHPSRRDLLRFTGCATAASAATLATAGTLQAAERPDAAYPLDRPECQIYSACLQCNTGCGIKVKVQDGVIVKIDGNP
jgi:anaerobic selenocysteine-containing dehydrogenase